MFVCFSMAPHVVSKRRLEKKIAIFQKKFGSKSNSSKAPTKQNADAQPPSRSQQPSNARQQPARPAYAVEPEYKDDEPEAAEYHSESTSRSNSRAPSEALSTISRPPSHVPYPQMHGPPGHYYYDQYPPRYASAPLPRTVPRRQAIIVARQTAREATYAAQVDALEALIRARKVDEAGHAAARNAEDMFDD